MKIIYLFIPLLILSFILMSCDDTGIVIPRNKVTFTPTNMKRLDKAVDGMYEAWVRLPDSVGFRYKSISKFNISVDGSKIVNENDEEILLKFKDTLQNIGASSEVIISVEPPGDIDTLMNGTKILGGIPTYVDDVLSADLTMDYPGVLGSFYSQLLSSNAKFILNTPSTSDSTDYFKGLWFCDMVQSGLLAIPILPDSVRWKYEGWIYNSQDSTWRSTGKFKDPSHKDDDMAGAYAGTTGIFWDKPGSDWVNDPVPVDFRSNYIVIYLSLEPMSESGQALSHMFPLTIYQVAPAGNLSMGELKALNNKVANFPKAKISISKYQ